MFSAVDLPLWDVGLEGLDLSDDLSPRSGLPLLRSGLLLRLGFLEAEPDFLLSS